ncbi:nuclear transport factor 2 family protein [Pseudoalteromonas obscura]|uniref:Nuclear transport factor 2 family protein n=1 Tax=Pseudoalteromonas obscura TaxID=3048491 RepID=A0ABT7EKD8_9GAMM|nr:nuclear transport factor 2 family protein [Pseudoalteromonas sp. P94(2023)]MDK2595519.1 nuclear transport factor 2 family protein [Pseudoalteromonas sp. P94(2023)]
MYTEIEQTTINIVDRQLEAYNNQDIDAFAATYSEDVEIYQSQTLVFKGKQALIERYGKKFSSLSYLHASSLTRIVQGHFLIDHELAQSSTLPSKEIDHSVKVVAAYEVKDGLICKVTFMG